MLAENENVVALIAALTAGVPLEPEKRNVWTLLQDTDRGSIFKNQQEDLQPCTSSGLD